jgi:protein-S-isoprenylcysteine O-methyltransferase Ste14
MSRKLFIQAIVRFLAGIVLMGALLFIPAGTADYPQAWLLMGILFIPMFIAGLIMMWKNPELLRKRLNAKEQESEQRTVILFSGIMFVAAFIAAGLSFRYQFLLLPFPVSIAGTVLFLLAYALWGEVMRENTYLSRTVEVQQGQKVIDTGLYGIVRHPMYAAAVLLFLSMGLVLGSLVSFVILLGCIPILAKRIRNEEKVLEEGLPGYREYKQKVKYRLVPFIW